MSRGALLGLFTLVLGCRSIPARGPEPSGRSSAAPASATKPRAGAEPTGDCPAMDPERAARDQQQGQALLDAARDGEHFRGEELQAALVTLRSAAEHGSLTAQSVYGSTLFSIMYMDKEPQPPQRDDYVAALAFLRIAGVRGDSNALAFIPGLAELRIVGASELDPDPPPEPLDQIPRAWLLDAVRVADAWLECERQQGALQWVRRALLRA